jgi:hypothetical protein
MVLSASGTISRSCCQRIVRLVGISAGCAICDLLPKAFILRTIETDRRRMMEACKFVRGEVEGVRIEIGWLCTTVIANFLQRNLQQGGKEGEFTLAISLCPWC